MSLQKVLLVDFGTRHINSLISTVKNLVGIAAMRMVRITRQGIPLAPHKYEDIETQVFANIFGMDSVLESDASIILSGSPDHVGDPAGFRSLSRKVLESFDGPIMGICYGHQLISTVWDKTITMEFRGGQGSATFLPVNTGSIDPIFKSVPMAGFLVAVRHNWSISKVPGDFIKLGETRTSYEIISGIKHKSRPIYGFQFHPELPVPGFWFGEDILRNFLSINLPIISEE